MKILNPTYALFVLLLWIAGCNDNPTRPEFDYEPEINVFGLLILDDTYPQKTVKLERTYGIKEYFPRFRGIEDATVIVRTEEQDVQFTHVFDGTYVDENDELQLMPGTLYQLDVTMADGHKIMSQCLMPARPRLLSPKPNQQVPAYTSLEMEWEETLFAHQYAVSVESELGSFEFTQLAEDTETDMFAFLFAGPGTYRARVSALDENYYDHARTRSNRDPILHIEGAIGVFGAIAFGKSVRFTAN